jgi:Neprosin
MAMLSRSRLELSRDWCVILVLLVVAGAQLICDSATPAFAQLGQSFDCVKRTATAEPPGAPPAPRSAATSSQPGNAAVQPLCPEGEVPVARQIAPAAAPAAAGTRAIKGNPLLKPESRAVEPQSGLGQQQSAQPRQVFRFRDVYGPALKNSKSARPAASPTQCLGTSQDNSCYYYGSAGARRSADGAGMMFSIDRPAYVNTGGGGGHSLSEISVQGGANDGNIVEVGWTVSTDQNGDADPHIFVFHWIKWSPTCYNACGWQQVSNTYYPAQN